MLERFKTLRSKFLFVLLIPALIITVTATAFFSVQTFIELKGDVLAKNESMAVLNAELLTAPMWNFDQAQVKQVVASIATDADVASVIVRNDEGENIAQFGEPDWEMVVRQDIVQVGVERSYRLGELEITYHMERIYASITRHVIETSLLLLVLVVGILVSAVFANRWIVDRPLGQLLQAIRLTEESGQRSFVEWQSEDEIGGVIAAYNAMQEKLSNEEQNLRVSEDRLAQAQRIVKMGNWDWNITNNALWWSDEIYRIFGLQPQEFEANYEAFIKTVHPDDRDIVSRSVDHAIYKNEPYSLDHRIVLSDGTEKVVHELGEVEFDATGKPIRMVGTVQDITERKHMEDALKKAKAEAEQANIAKSKFLSSMSHELRTPLNAILGFGQLLELEKDKKLDENQREAVKQIMRGGEHLLTLVEEVLDLSKIESGEMRLDIETVSPGKAIKQSLMMTKSMASRYDVQVKAFDFGQDLPLINVDVMRFKQILLNLLSNAVKYNRPQGHVSLKCEQVVPGMARFSVTDTGNGIPEDMFDILFVPFERLKHEAGNIEGTGIGLNITKDLVELMDGRIGFESQVGKGSTFWVEFPIAEEKPSQVEPLTEGVGGREGGSTDSVQSGRTYSILYVEDNPANVALMGEVITMMGNVELRTARDAELGISMARGDPPDLILMDIHLPGIDGVEALRVLKEGGETARIPVVAVSADAMAENIKTAMDEGFEDYITKPFKLPEITSKISKILNR